MSYLVPANARTTSSATDTITADDLQGGSVGYGVSCTVTVPQNVPEGRGVTLYATADGVTISVSVSGGDSVSGSPTTLVTNQAILLTKTAPTVWRLLQLGALTTTWRACRLYASGGVLGWQEYALAGSGTTPVSSFTALTVETGSSAQASFSGSDMTIKTGIGTGGGGACQSAPYEAYVLFSSLSSTFQALIATGAMATLTIKMATMDIGVATSQWAVVLTGGLVQPFNSAAECFMTLALRQGVTASAARTLTGYSNSVANLPSPNAYASWSGRLGLGLADSDTGMYANAASANLVPTTTGATSPTTTDGLYWTVTGVTTPPGADVTVTSPEVWFILQSPP